MRDWKTLLIGGLVLVVGSLALVAWASIERPSCHDWDEWWFHHRATVGHIRWCISNNHVDINQQDEEGRTLLHRFAADLDEDREWFYNPDTHTSYEGRTRAARLAGVKEILRWQDTRNLDLEIVDEDGRTAFHLAIRRGEGRPMAALLLQAGAAVTASPGGKKRIEEEYLPLLRAFGARFNNPFEGKVNFDKLFECQTADCLLAETVKDD